MNNKSKAAMVAGLLCIMFYAVLYCITIFYENAWRVYGIVFGIIGAIAFAILVYAWISADEPRATYQERRMEVFDYDR